MGEIIERIMGGGGVVGGIFGEAREALVGGCWGIFMSAGFFFVFFVGFLGLIFGVEFPQAFYIRPVAFPLICLIGISGLLSPFVGMLFGANSGMYSMITHVGCFVLYIAILIAGIIAVSIFI